MFLVEYISEYVFWIVNHLGMTLGQLTDSVMGNTFWKFFMVWRTGSYFQAIFTLSTNWKQPKSDYDKLFPVDTLRRFNVDTTSYDVVSTLKRRRGSTGLVFYSFEGVHGDDQK